jgi:enterochelin esterase-like enzyme
LSKRTVVRKEIESVHLHETRSLRIFLPPDYDEFLSYPVIYCQDGEDFFNFGRVATFAQEGIKQQGLKPMIIVGIDVDKRKRTEEYAPDGSIHADYLSFFVKELIPFIDSTFAAHQDRESRILAGDSLGATVSIHLALAYPEYFGKVISLSGAFFHRTREAIKQSKDLSNLSMYMLIGLDETEVKTGRGTFDFLEENRKTKAFLEQQGVQIHYQEEEGTHIWGFWQTYVPKALSHFF